MQLCRLTSCEHIEYARRNAFMTASMPRTQQAMELSSDTSHCCTILPSFISLRHLLRLGHVKSIVTTRWQYVVPLTGQALKPCMVLGSILALLNHLNCAYSCNEAS